LERRHAKQFLEATGEDAGLAGRDQQSGLAVGEEVGLGPARPKGSAQWWTRIIMAAKKRSEVRAWILLRGLAKASAGSGEVGDVDGATVKHGSSKGFIRAKLKR